MIPEKIKRNPFVTWAFVLLTIGFLAWVFGPENVWALITDWARPDNIGV